MSSGFVDSNIGILVKMFWLYFYMFKSVKTTSYYKAFKSVMRKLLDALLVCLINLSCADFLKNLLTPKMKKFSIILDFLGEGSPLEGKGF